MKVIGLKSGIKSINWGVSGHLRDLKVTLKLKLHTYIIFYRQRFHVEITFTTVRDL